jgi:two-component system, OmpR family, response regulator PhoP
MNAPQDATAAENISVCTVEDDDDLREEIIAALASRGFAVRGFSCAGEFYKGLLQAPCDIIVLDINLPGENGIAVAEFLHGTSQAGIIMLTGCDHIEDRVRALLKGADVYLVKPVDFDELAANILSLVRRVSKTRHELAHRAKEGAATGPGWRFSADARELQAPDGTPVALTLTEQKLMAALFATPGLTVTRETLVSALGHRSDYYDSHRLDMLISRFRRKVFNATAQNLPLQAVRGVGFILVDGN